MPPNKIDLSKFNNKWFKPGRYIFVRFFWIIFSRIFINTSIPWPYFIKSVTLVIFGCHIGRGLVIKPQVNIKYPWKLTVGDYCWIGEGVWLDSLDKIILGNNVCISQGAYLETGSHDPTDLHFGLILNPITIEDGAWVGAKTILLPGCFIKTHAVISAGSVFSGIAKAYGVYVGNPATFAFQRIIDVKEKPGNNEKSPAS